MISSFQFFTSGFKVPAIYERFCNPQYLVSSLISWNEGFPAVIIERFLYRETVAIIIAVYEDS